MANRREKPPTEGDVSLDLNHYLEPGQRNQLYLAMRSIVWLVKAKVRNIENEPIYSTGFCMGDAGYIVLCEGGLLDNEGTSYSVRARGDSREYKTKLVVRSRKHGYAVLKINLSSNSSIETKSFDYGKFEDTVQIDIGMNVFGISHDISRHTTDSYCFFMGRVVSGTMRRSEIEIYNDRVIAGWFNGLDKDVQFFSIGGCPRTETSMGAPVFNSRGHVIGLIAATDNGFLYAMVVTTVMQGQIQSIMSR